jgi:hypothetical protein
MLADIARIISIVMAVLGAVGAQTGLDIGKIAPIIAKITEILGSLSGLTTPSTVDAAIADLSEILSTLNSEGVLTEVPIVEEALAVIAKFKVVESDYMDGQAAIISSNFSFNGVPGDLLAVSKNGAAAKLLGM